MKIDQENPSDMTKWTYWDGTPVILDGQISEKELDEMYTKAREQYQNNDK